MRREVNEYQLFEAQKMDFTLEEYMNYVGSFETREEILKEIKQIANEYLSKAFENRIATDSRRRISKFSDK